MYVCGEFMCVHACVCVCACVVWRARPCSLHTCAKEKGQAKVTLDY